MTNKSSSSVAAAFASGGEKRIITGGMESPRDELLVEKNVVLDEPPLLEFPGASLGCVGRGTATASAAPPPKPPTPGSPGTCDHEIPEPHKTVAVVIKNSLFISYSWVAWDEAS